MNKNQLVYYPNNNFNGVLIILREPHIQPNETQEEALRGNRSWFEHVISDQPMNYLRKRYKNRFSEMLAFCNKTNLSSIAFTNINLSGGGSSASLEYWKMSKDKAINDVIEATKPQIVFTVRELFEIATADFPKTSGLKYSNNKVLRMAISNGITFYEIYHPCYTRKIIV